MNSLRISLAFLLLTVLAGFAVAQDSGGVRGQVRNQKGDGLAGTLVTARQDGKDIKSVKTDGKGKFEMTGLAPGKYNIVFDKSGYASGAKFNVEVRRGEIVNLGDRLILAVDQGTLVMIRGSVFNQDGRSITGAKVELEKVNADGSVKKLGTVYTNVSGEFAFRQPEGTATFRVTASLKNVKASKEVVVDNAAIYRLALTLNLPKE